MRHSAIVRKGNRRFAQTTAGVLLKEEPSRSFLSRRTLVPARQFIASPRSGQKSCPKLRPSLRRPAYVSYRRSALYSRLAMGCRPFEPHFKKTELNEERNSRPLDGAGHPRSPGRARSAQTERRTPRLEHFGLRPADLSGSAPETNARREKAASRAGTHRIEPEPDSTLGQYL